MYYRLTSRLSNRNCYIAIIFTILYTKNTEHLVVSQKFCNINNLYFCQLLRIKSAHYSRTDAQETLSHKILIEHQFLISDHCIRLTKFWFCDAQHHTWSAYTDQMWSFPLTDMHSFCTSKYFYDFATSVIMRHAQILIQTPNSKDAKLFKYLCNSNVNEWLLAFQIFTDFSLNIHSRILIC
jgi:hypothetical protein